MANATSKWLTLSLIALGCGGSQAAAPAGEHVQRGEGGECEWTEPSGVEARQRFGRRTARFGRRLARSSTKARASRCLRAQSRADKSSCSRSPPRPPRSRTKESEKPLGPTFLIRSQRRRSRAAEHGVSIPLPTLPSGWGDPSIAYEVASGAEIRLRRGQHAHQVAVRTRQAERRPRGGRARWRDGAAHAVRAHQPRSPINAR